MADIYAFPVGAPADGRPGTPAVAQGRRPERPAGVPDEMWRAVESVHAMERIPDVRYREIPVPSTLADFGIGVEIECGPVDGGTAASAGDDAPARVAEGWIMVLYSVEERSDWQSRWRCVAFARVPLDGGERDCLTPAMYWDDMRARLAAAGAGNVGGTVTVTQNTSFGVLEDDDPGAGCEMRVSWTPADAPSGVDAGGQVAVWSGFVRSAVRFGDEEEDER